MSYIRTISKGFAPTVQGRAPTFRILGQHHLSSKMKISNTIAITLALASAAQGFSFSSLSNGMQHRSKVIGGGAFTAALVGSTANGLENARLPTRLFTTMSAQPYTVKASHILVKTEDECNLILDGLQSAGWEFANVAAESSSCPSGKAGGDLGWFGKGQMVPEFEQACFGGAVGDLVKVETQFGWHVIRIDEQNFEKPKPEPVAVRARHILVQDEGVADNLMNEIETGADFEGLAQQQSSCPSKAQGGDLGWFGRNQMVKEFEDACYAANEGDLMKVKTQFGWHVLQLTGKMEPPKEMSVKELSELLGDASERESIQFIDVREEEELANGNNLTAQGFVNLPLSKSQEWAPKIASGELLDKDKKTVCMCKMGMRSMQMAQFLMTQGSFTDVVNVEGGMDAYAAEVGL